MSEKILARASGKDTVEAGDIVIANIDVAMTHDLTGPLSVESFEKIGAENLIIRFQQIQLIRRIIILL